MENRFEEAFEVLDMFVADPEVLAGIKQLRTVFNGIKNDYRDHVINEERRSERTARISKSLLEIVSGLKNELRSTNPENEIRPTNDRKPNTPSAKKNQDVSEKSNDMFHTIGNDKLPLNLKPWESGALQQAYKMLTAALESMQRLEMNSHYLPEVTKNLVRIEAELKELKSHLIATDNESTSLDAKLESLVSKTKEVLKEIATARRQMRNSESADFIRNHHIPYFEVNLESFCRELNRAIGKFSSN